MGILVALVMDIAIVKHVQIMCKRLLSNQSQSLTALQVLHVVSPCQSTRQIHVAKNVDRTCGFFFSVYLQDFPGYMQRNGLVILPRNESLIEEVLNVEESGAVWPLAIRQNDGSG